MIRTLIDDLDPRGVAWIRRALDEHDRRHGRVRALVLRMIAPDVEEVDEGNGFTTRVVRTRHRSEPTHEDVAAALRESPGEPIPSALLDYVNKTFVLATRPQKPGRKTPTRSTWEEIAIVAFYQHQIRKAHDRAKAGLTRSPATRAKERTARKFGLSLRTLEAILTADRQRRAIVGQT